MDSAYSVQMASETMFYATPSSVTVIGGACHRDWHDAWMCIPVMGGSVVEYCGPNST